MNNYDWENRTDRFVLKIKNILKAVRQTGI